MKNIKITLPNGSKHTFPEGTTLKQIADALFPNPPLDILACRVNNTIKELWEKLDCDCQLEFIDLSYEDGLRIYQRGLSFVLVKACKELFPDHKTLIEHSLNKGFFCELENTKDISKEDVKRIEKRMGEIIELDLPFIKRTLSKKDAISLFKKEGEPDKVHILRYSPKDPVYLYELEGLIDYFYGYMPPATGVLKLFELRYYPPGFLLRFPEPSNPTKLPEFIENKQLAQIFYEYKNWGRILDISDVGYLNEIISKGEINDLIRVAEALHEKKIAQIADLINVHRERLRLILIAGPTSSGKTTFAQRLAVQLRVNGLKPVPISLDDYFVDRGHTPRNENGNPDFESIEAIDLKLFNEHLQKLINGEEVIIPRFDFVAGERKLIGKKLKISEKHLLLVEGIHTLNEKLTKSISKNNKYKIYVSCLTQLNLDDHNRISTTDCRLIRRIVRDNLFRGHNATATIKMWPQVTYGENKNIFPFQEEADIMFNSALVYEMSVLKDFVKPLLEEIDQSYPEHSEAKRLLSFVDYFLSVGTDEIPPNSILREFVGATCFFKTEV